MREDDIRVRWHHVLFALLLGATGALVLLGSASASPWMTGLSARWLPEGTLVVPVAGVTAEELVSTWHAPRPGGRRHKGTDIMAPKGTPVVSASDGTVRRVGTNALGGKVVWVDGTNGASYYYAHLDAWAPGLRTGDRVYAGDRLGTVGNTGNAATTPPHLHFGVQRQRFIGKQMVDPVPLFVSASTLERGEAPSTRARRRFRLPY